MSKHRRKEPLISSWKAHPISPFSPRSSAAHVPHRELRRSAGAAGAQKGCPGVTVGQQRALFLFPPWEWHAHERARRHCALPRPKLWAKDLCDSSRRVLRHPDSGPGAHWLLLDRKLRSQKPSQWFWLQPWYLILRFSPFSICSCNEHIPVVAHICGTRPEA